MKIVFLGCTKFSEDLLNTLLEKQELVIINFIKMTGILISTNGKLNLLQLQTMKMMLLEKTL